MNGKSLLLLFTLTCAGCEAKDPPASTPGSDGGFSDAAGDAGTPTPDGGNGMPPDASGGADTDAMSIDDTNSGPDATGGAVTDVDAGGPVDAVADSAPEVDGLTDSTDGRADIQDTTDDPDGGATGDALDGSPSDAEVYADAPTDVAGTDASDAAVADSSDAAGADTTDAAIDAVAWDEEPDGGWALALIGEPIPEVTPMVVPGFQGGLYGCDDPTVLPAPDEVPGPCYLIEAHNLGAAFPIYHGVRRFGYNCELRNVYSSIGDANDDEPSEVEYFAYTTGGLLDEHTLDYLLKDGKSFVENHSYDAESRLVEVSYTYPKGWSDFDPDPIDYELYTYTTDGRLESKVTYAYPATLEASELVTTEKHYYSPDGAIELVDFYDGTGTLQSRNTRLWKGTLLMEEWEDMGAACTTEPLALHYYTLWCASPGPDGELDRGTSYTYNSAGQITRLEWWLPNGYTSNGQLLKLMSELYVYKYRQDGRIAAELRYTDDEKHLYYAMLYEYDDFGREKRRAAWSSNPSIWVTVYVNNYDCWSAP